MAQAAGTQRKPDFTFSLRLPGWLLIAALLVLLGYFVFVNMRNAVRVNGSSLGGSMRVTLLHSSTANGVFSADAILESNKTIDDAATGWSIGLDRGASVPAVATVEVTGARTTHAVYVHLFASIPSGKTAQTLNYQSPRRDFTTGWQLSIPTSATLSPSRSTGASR